MVSDRVLLRGYPVEVQHIGAREIRAVWQTAGGVLKIRVEGRMSEGGGGEAKGSLVWSRAHVTFLDSVWTVYQKPGLTVFEQLDARIDAVVRDLREVLDLNGPIWRGHSSD